MTQRVPLSPLPLNFPRLLNKGNTSIKSPACKRSSQHVSDNSPSKRTFPKTASIYQEYLEKLEADALAKIELEGKVRELEESLRALRRRYREEVSRSSALLAQIKTDSNAPSSPRTHSDATLTTVFHLPRIRSNSDSVSLEEEFKGLAEVQESINGLEESANELHELFSQTYESLQIYEGTPQAPSLLGPPLSLSSACYTDCSRTRDRTSRRTAAEI